MMSYKKRNCEITRRLAEDMMIRNLAEATIDADTSIQKVMKQSGQRAGIHKRIYPHVLRHHDGAPALPPRTLDQRAEPAGLVTGEATADVHATGRERATGGEWANGQRAGWGATSLAPSEELDGGKGCNGYVLKTAVESAKGFGQESSQSTQLNPQRIDATTHVRGTMTLADRNSDSSRPV